jgi:hypothetical protein
MKHIYNIKQHQPPPFTQLAENAISALQNLTGISSSLKILHLGPSFCFLPHRIYLLLKTPLSFASSTITYCLLHTSILLPLMHQASINSSNTRYASHPFTIAHPASRPFNIYTPLLPALSTFALPSFLALSTYSSCFSPFHHCSDPPFLALSTYCTFPSSPRSPCFSS